MSIPSLSIRNPVMVTMFCIALIVLGIIGFVKAPLQEQPNITYPTISIHTELPGANAKTVTQTVTKPLEKALNTIANLQSLNSSSTPGTSKVTLNFRLGTNMAETYNQVENKLNHIRTILPKNVRPPLISLADSSGASIIQLALFGPQNLSQLDDYARHHIVTKLQNLPGVGDVILSGAGEQSVSVIMNLHKMAALKIAPTDVQSAFSRDHIELPGGVIRSGKKQYVLNLDLEYHKISDLKNLIVSYRHQAPIYLKDIADISFGIATNSGKTFYNHHPSIGISVVRQGEANTINVINEVNETIKTGVNPYLPAGMELQTVYSQHGFIMRILHQLEQDVWLAIVMAAIIIFLFLRRFRPTMIILGVVPISILGAVAVIYATGYSINAVTLLGLTVLVGIVVDDSIIVLENIFRTLQKRKNLDDRQAAVIGANQVARPVLACSFALISIFLPIVFMGGFMGLLFKPFAVVVSAGVVISLILALTFNPVLCSRFLKADRKESRLGQWLLNIFNALQAGFVPVLRVALKHRWISILIVIIMVAAIYPAFKYVGKTFMPTNNNTGYFTVQIQAPEGMSTAYTRERVASVEKILKHYPDIQNFLSTTGPTANQGSISVDLKPMKELSMPQKQLMDVIQHKINKIPGALYYVQLPIPDQVTFQIRGPSFEEVINRSYKLLDKVQKHPELGPSYIYLGNQQPQFQVFVDRVLASSLGITSADVANTLSLMGSDGVRIGKFTRGNAGDRYDILLRTKKDEFSSPDDLSSIYVHGPKGQGVRLNTIVNIEKSMLPSKITRTDLQYSIVISTQPTISTNKAIALIQKLAASDTDKVYQLHLTGNTADLASTEHNMLLTLVLILGFIYLVLASQFNSFVQPLIVMMMQPLTVIGGLFVLLIFSQTLNVYSMIAMLLLVGLATKNTIMLVSLTNNLVTSGTKVYDALMEVGPERMRPILMTSLALILAMVPPAIDPANTYRSMSLVVIGGIIVSSLLSLIVVPSFYSLFAQIAPPRKRLEVNLDQEK